MKPTHTVRTLPTLLTLFLVASPGAAQESARIIGRVLHAQTAQPIVGAQVAVDGGALGGALTDLDGRFVTPPVPVGTVTVTVNMIGYHTKTVTDVEIAGDRPTVIDFTMTEATLELEGITISARRERGSQAFLLDERRTSAFLVDAVGSTEISRRPDSDAAEVARRLSGVTVSEGKYVFVRGLGERYSQTTLNGSSLPSPEPEREVVPLDLFPSGFLQSLRTQKSYTPDLPADFSGGSVKIETKDFPSETVLRFGVGSSANTNSQFRSGYLSYAGGGRDWIGIDDGTRSQPQALEEALGPIDSGERLPANAGQIITLGETLRSYGQGFNPSSGATPVNRSLNASIGGRTDLFDEGELGYFIAGTYGDNYTLRENEQERKWRSSGFDPQIPENLRTPNVDYNFTRGTRNVTWGGIGNITFKFNPEQKLSLRTTASLSADDEARSYIGENQEDIGGVVRSERLRFVSRLMLWSQLSGEHAIAGSRLEWRATGARATRDEPLMREAVYLEDDGEFFLLPIGESGRYFWSDMSDRDVSFALDWQLPLDFLGDRASLKIGGEGRERSRDFAARRLNWNFLGTTVTDLDAALANARIVSNARRRGEFALRDIVEPGDLYDATDRRFAGYGLLDFSAGRLQAVLGARVEAYELGLRSRGDTLAGIDQLDIAPSVNLVFAARDDFRIRAAGSRTVDRPEFREMAPFQFTEATSLRQLFGNPDLVPASITSADLRFDWFPGPGEMLSVGGFTKRMTDPVEQVFIAAASTAYSFQNAKDATVLGIEMEGRLRLDRIAEALLPYSVQANYSLITSEVEVREGAGGFNPTNLTRPLEGQAAYVLNAGVNYGDGRVEWGLFLNRFGDRLTAAGGDGVPDLFEKARSQVDATFGFPLPTGAAAKFKATNLLDAGYRFEQEANGIVQVQRLYTTGRTFSVGLSWELR
ncbi:MAG: TonB-dependent receptor [Gemmatimonadetes bacterium]|nr:TonB-dependent receptor [Gemmatimonadota bacterium]